MTWYDEDYGYKKQITIDYLKVGSDELDFPVLISVTDDDLRVTGSGGHVENNNGYDIIFTNGAETVQLKHEIERYVSTTGLLVFWVKIPSLSSLTDTDFYIYYGKTGVSVDPSTTDTWDSNYLAVYHMDESSGSTCYDSTSNSNHGTYYGSLPTQATGKIGYGQNFVASNPDYLLLPSGTFLSGSDYGTLEAIVDFDITTVGAVWAQYIAGNERCYLAATSGNYIYDGENASGNQWSQENTAIGAGWQIIAYGMKVDDVSLRVNNVEIYTDNSCDMPAGSFNQNPVGYLLWASVHPLDGTVDEIRVSSLKRSGNWLSTTYETQNDPAGFMSWGNEETGKILYAPSDTINISDNVLFEHKFNLLDTINVDDNIIYKHLINLIDTININDSLIIKRLLNLTDSVDITDDVILKHMISLTDSININDETVYKHIVALADSIGITDTILLKHLLSLFDSINIEDSPLYKHFINLIDIVSISDDVDFGGLTYIFDNISILDEIDIAIKDTCGTVFQLQGTSYTVFLPIPEYAGEAGSIDNELELFNFWTNDISVETIGLNSEPIILGGTIFACTDDEEVEMTAIAAKFLNVHEMMDNNEEIRITGLHNCVDAIYVIKNFRYRTIRRSPYAYTWQLTLEYVRAS